MDVLTLFGFASALLMLAFYALEDYSTWCVLGFAVAAALASLSAVLLTAYWVAALFAVWALIAGRRWQNRRLAGKPQA